MGQRPPPPSSQPRRRLRPRHSPTSPTRMAPASLNTTPAPAGCWRRWSPPTVAAGPGPRELTVSPDGGSALRHQPRREQRLPVRRPARVADFPPKSPATIGTDRRPFGVNVSPDGRSVIRRQLHRRLLWRHRLPVRRQLRPGRLSPKNPPTVFADRLPFAVAVSPDGRSVYVTNFKLEANGSVSQYDVGPGGRLSPKSPAAVIAAQDPGRACGKPRWAKRLRGEQRQQHHLPLRRRPGREAVPQEPGHDPETNNSPLRVAVSPQRQKRLRHKSPPSHFSPSTVSQFNVGAGGHAHAQEPSHGDEHG